LHADCCLGGHFTFVDLFFLLIGMVLYYLDKMQHVETVNGFWVIFVPFAPAVVWALFMYIKASNSERGTEGDTGKDKRE
jgi:hypothetical protein